MISGKVNSVFLFPSRAHWSIYRPPSSIQLDQRPRCGRGNFQCAKVRGSTPRRISFRTESDVSCHHLLIFYLFFFPIFLTFCSVHLFLHDAQFITDLESGLRFKVMSFTFVGKGYKQEKNAFTSWRAILFLLEKRKKKWSFNRLRRRVRDPSLERQWEIR